MAEFHLHADICISFSNNLVLGYYFSMIKYPEFSAKTTLGLLRAETRIKGERLIAYFHEGLLKPEFPIIPRKNLEHLFELSIKKEMGRLSS